MAYHHDPRYGPSPYSFQQQFHPPQPQLHQHNYGMAHPVGPAPPQSYLPPRNPMFPGQMTPQSHINMHARMGPEYPGGHAYDPAFQHNSQYNPAFPGPNPPPPPGIHNHSSPFQNMPFQPPVPITSGSMQANTRPLLIPPPPGMQQQSQQSASSPGSATWPQNHGLPPKPPAIGFNEPVQLSTGQSHHSSYQNLGSSGEKSQGFTSSNNHLPSHTIDLTPMNQNPEAKRPPPSQQQQQKQQYQAHDLQHPPGQMNSVPTPSQVGSSFAAGATSRPLQKDDRPKQPVIIDLSQSRNEKARTPDVVSPSPDIYSPQSHTGGLPGLGSVDDVSLNVDHTVHKEIGGRERVQPGKPPLEKALQAKLIDRSVSLNPFAMKQDALSAVRDLDAQKIKFTEIAAEGIDAQVLERLYSELGIARNPRKPEPSQVVEKIIATKDATSQPQLDKAGQPEKKPVALLQPSKAMPREDYIAKLKAATSGKPIAKERSEGDVQDNPVVVDGSDSGNESTQAPPQSATNTQKKTIDSKVLTTTDKVRQRLEALKKTMGEKQKQVSQVAHTNHAAEAKPSSEYTPANPFFSAEAVNASIPGLSMSVEPEQKQTDHEGYENTVNAAGKRVGDSSMDSADARKRIRQQSMSGDIRYQEAVRPSTSSDARQIVIELSDDEEEGEVSESLSRPPMQRHFSDGITYQDTSVQKQSNQSQLQQQSHRDDLAAREEEIRLFRQKIAVLEAKAKAKKAVAYSATTPTPSTTPGQTTQADQNAPPAVSVNKSGLSAMSERVEAQQQSLVAAKAAIEDRLEKEEQAYETAIVTNRLSTSLNGHDTSEHERRQEKILALKQSLEKVHTQIMQTEIELDKVKTLEEDLQRQLERGIKNRDSFNDELRALMDITAAEIARNKSPALQEPDPAEVSAENTAMNTEMTAYHPDTEARENDVRVDMSEDNSSDSGSSEGADETMDISDADEGEITDSENEEQIPGSQHSPPGGEVLPETQRSSPGTDTSSLYKTNSVDGHPEEQIHGQLTENDEPPMDVEEDYEPQSDKESSESEQMDYEPDYEPEPDPAMVRSDSSEANDYEPQGEYTASQNGHEFSESPHSEEGEIVEDATQLGDESSERSSDAEEDSVMDETADMKDFTGEHDSNDGAVFGATMTSDRAASDDLPGLGSDDDDQEAGEDADVDNDNDDEDDEDDEEGEQEEEEEEEGEDSVTGEKMEAEPAVIVDTDANASADSDADSVVYADDAHADADADDADADDDDAEAFQANNSVGFTPYESPLQMFKAYKYHPECEQTALPPDILRCETCNEVACPYRHFGQLKLSGVNCYNQCEASRRCYPDDCLPTLP